MYLTKKAWKGTFTSWMCLISFSELKRNVSIICHGKICTKYSYFLSFFIFEHACYDVCGFSGCISDVKHTWRRRWGETFCRRALLCDNTIIDLCPLFLEAFGALRGRSNWVKRPDATQNPLLSDRISACLFVRMHVATCPAVMCSFCKILYFSFFTY